MVGCCCRVAADPDVANQVQWDRSFAIGSLAEASVHELKDYGVVFDFAAHADVLGLAALHQASAFSWHSCTLQLLCRQTTPSISSGSKCSSPGLPLVLQPTYIMPVSLADAFASSLGFAATLFCG